MGCSDLSDQLLDELFDLDKGLARRREVNVIHGPIRDAIRPLGKIQDHERVVFLAFEGDDPGGIDKIVVGEHPPCWSRVLPRNVALP